jgi:predicted PurR-regulated permease PerM
MQQDERDPRFDGIIIALTAVVLGAMTYIISPSLSPFALFLVLLLLLVPNRRYRSAQTILTASSIVFALWFVLESIQVLFPFIIGFVLAYLFNPLVTYLHEKRRISRVWSSIVIVLMFCSLISIAGYFLIPVLVRQTQDLLSNIAGYFERSSITFDEAGVRQFFLSLGVPQQYVDEYVSGQLIPQLKVLMSRAPAVMIEALMGIPKFLEQLINLIIIPVSFLYLLIDWHKMTRSALELFPLRRRNQWKQIFTNIDGVLYAYIRGQSTVAIIIGTLAGIIFSILGVPYAIIIGVIITFLDLIPFLGLIMSIVIVMFIILVTLPITIGNILMGPIVVLSLHMLEAYFLGPRIVGKGVGIPPILLILSIFIFGYFLGFVGMLVAVPTTGILLLFLREYKHSVAHGAE